MVFQVATVGHCSRPVSLRAQPRWRGQLWVTCCHVPRFHHIWVCPGDHAAPRAGRPAPSATEKGILGPSVVLEMPRASLAHGLWLSRHLAAVPQPRSPLSATEALLPLRTTWNPLPGPRGTADSLSSFQLRSNVTCSEKVGALDI